MAEEKFISIDYNTWLSKYKPMEEENERLRGEIKELTSNNVHISVTLSSRSGYGFETSVGYIEVQSHSNVKTLVWHDRGRLEKYVNDTVTDTISRSHAGNWYIGRQEAESRIDKMARLIKHNEGLLEKNKQRISGIPKIIKWLFKIKQ